MVAIRILLVESLLTSDNIIDRAVSLCIIRSETVTVQLSALVWHVRDSWADFPITTISFSYGKKLPVGSPACIRDKAGSVYKDHLCCGAGVNTGAWHLERLVQLAPYKDARELAPGRVRWRYGDSHHSTCCRSGSAEAEQSHASSQWIDVWQVSVCS